MRAPVSAPPRISVPYRGTTKATFIADARPRRRAAASDSERVAPQRIYRWVPLVDADPMCSQPPPPPDMTGRRPTSHERKEMAAVGLVPTGAASTVSTFHAASWWRSWLRRLAERGTGTPL